MIPEYDPKFDWQTNIADLASKLESLLVEREKTRETIHPYPNTNVPTLAQANEDAVAQFDAQTELLSQQYGAASVGMFWWDPDSTKVPTVSLNRKLMTWFKEANQRGKLMYPDELRVSAHKFGPEPLLVRRDRAPSEITPADPQAGYRRV